MSNDEDGNLQRALQESVRDTLPHTISYGTEKSVPTVSRDQVVDDDDDDDDEDLRRALQLSLQQNDNSPDNDLRRALQMSLECELLLSIDLIFLDSYSLTSYCP